MNMIGSNNFGTLSSAPDGGILNHIYKYLDTILEDFKGSSSENENKITNRLCKTLNSRKNPESPYYFHHQNIESDRENTSTDFAAFGTYAYAQELGLKEEDSPPLIKFEAKRLSSTIPKKREREYVVGEYQSGTRINNSGGIERFKNGRHGANVSVACLIGYVQSESFPYWLTKINSFIQDEVASPQDAVLTWTNEDVLKMLASTAKLASFSSASKRFAGDVIYLKHLWINMV